MLGDTQEKDTLLQSGNVKLCKMLGESLEILTLTTLLIVIGLGYFNLNKKLN